MRENLAAALNEALQDEYKACATYRAIIQRFGPVKPFINILAAEERHIRALVPLFAKYEVPVPVNDWPQRVKAPASLAQACQEGVEAEIENGAMYERLLLLVADYPDIQQVFRQLQRASQENHLPAFQRGVARESRWTTEDSETPLERRRFGRCAGVGRHAATLSTDGSASQGQGRRRHRGGRRFH
jgi:hypothetical protein